MPVAIPILIGLAVGGGVTQAVGGIKAGNAAKKAGQKQADAAEAEGQAALESSESQATLADYNAQVASLQAQDAIIRGTQEENRFRTGVRALIGSQRADFAASGVDVGFGSAVDVQADAAFLGEMDALQIRTNAAREAWGFKVQAEDSRARAGIARKEGKNALEVARLGGKAAVAQGNAAATASRWGAASTLLGTGASLLQSRYGKA